jgi:hypothetical protein
VPAVFSEMFGAGETAIAIGRLALPPTPPDAGRRAFRVRPHELDPMGHANNAVYLDWLEESLLAAGAADAIAGLPRRYRLEYALAADAGAPLEAAVWPADGGWSFRLTHATSGADLFRARLEPGTGDATDEEDDA